MPFKGFSKDFVKVYSGFGRYSAAATAGAAAAALIAPALLKTEDRGYARTAAITTPLIGAGYVAAPGLFRGARDFAGQWGDFWQKKPFHLDKGIPRFDDLPDLARKVNLSGGHVRSAMHGVVQEKTLDYYGSLKSRPYNTTMHANQALNGIPGTSRMEHTSGLADFARTHEEVNQQLWEMRRLVNEARKRGENPESIRTFQRTMRAEIYAKASETHSGLRGRRRFLSYAMNEAERSVFPGDDTLRNGIRPQWYQKPKLNRPVAGNQPLLDSFEALRGNERFVQKISGRVRQAGRLNFAFEALPGRMGLPVMQHQAFSAGNALSIAEEEMHLSGAAVRKVQRIEEAVRRGWISPESRIIFGADQTGNRTGMLGADIVDIWNRRTTQLPFIGEAGSYVTMGPNWNLRGIATDYYDLERRALADEAVLAHIDRAATREGWKDIEQAIGGAFHYGGVTNPSDPMDVALHTDFLGAEPPEWAMNIRKRGVKPNPFSTFEGKPFAELNLEEQARVTNAAMSKFNLSKVASEHGLIEGRLEEAGLEAASLSGVSFPGKQDAVVRALSKPMHFDPASIQNLDHPAFDSTFFGELGIHSREEMPLFVAKEGMITPQVKSLLGDIPEEAERAVRSAFSSGIKDPAARANKWWDLPSGRAYSVKARDYIRKEIESLYPNNPDLLSARVEEVFDRYKQALTEDPLKVVAARQAGAAGEVIGLYGDTLDTAELMMRKNVTAASLAFDPNHIPAEGLTFKPGEMIGMSADGPVTALGDFTVPSGGVQEIVRDGQPSLFKVSGIDRYSMEGAKVEFGAGGAKGLMHHVPGDQHARLLEVINEVNKSTGVGAVLARDTQVITLATTTGLKDVNQYATLMEAASRISLDLAYGDHLTSASQSAWDFLHDMEASHGMKVVEDQLGRHLQVDHKKLMALGIEQRAQEAVDVSRKASGFLDRVGELAVGDQGLQSIPFLESYRETAAARAAAGNSRISLSDYLARGERFSWMMGWDHSRVNMPKQVGITYDMFTEMHRLGHVEGAGELWQDVRWTQGDPRRAGAVAEYLRGRDFEKPIGEVLTRKEISGAARLADPEARTLPNSVFNPDWSKVQENFSLDLGATFKDVEFAGGSTNVRYLPKLGMQSYKGAPNRFSGGFQSTDLEHAYNQVLNYVQDVDFAKLDPASKAAAPARDAISKYMNLLAQEMSGKEGYLRAPGVHPNATWGVAAVRSSGVGGEDPFRVSISKETFHGIEDKAIRDALEAGQEVPGVMFRHPISAGHYVKYRYSPGAHLGPNQFGIDARLSGPYQMDHDLDRVQAIFFSRNSPGWKEAVREIDDRNSNQWLSLEASEMFQGLEDPRNVTGAMFETEAKEKGFFGKNSYLSKLEEAAKVDGSVAASRANSFRARLAGKYVGHYSNELTKLQLMLSGNPLLRPGDRDYAFLDKMMYDIRQATISAMKDKMDLGSNPLQMLNDLDRAVSRGEHGVDDAQRIFTQIAHGSGFKSVVDERTIQLTGLESLHSKIGEAVNVGEEYAASERGREALAKLLNGPNNRQAGRFAAAITRGELTPSQAVNLMNQAGGAGPELRGLMGGEVGRTAENMQRLFGETAGRGAEDASRALGAINSAVKDSWQTARKAAGPSAKVLGFGLGLAAVAGLAATSVSSNKQRPEEQIATTDHVPGDPIAGSRSPVNPKRMVLPPPKSVKTVVVAPMQQSVNLEVRAKAPDRAGQMQVAKLVDRTMGSNGLTNMTVNRTGGWRDAASKLRLREQIRDELNRY